MYLISSEIIKLILFCSGSDTNSWTELALPQLSLPRAGHSIITMETARDAGADVDVKTMLVFGGGDNEGKFYSDLTTVAVDELLAAI